MGKAERTEEAPTGFYEAVLEEAEAESVRVASHLEGLEQEIALLRGQLRRLLREHPEELELMQGQVALIVRAVQTNYRMSDRHRDSLAESIEALLRDVGETLWPTS